jgi:large subunit ribosomal protein L7Ae
MPKKSGAKGGQVVTKKGGAKTTSNANSLFKKSPRNFRIGADIQPTRNLTRFVKWPKYVRIQRQKRVLMMRLKMPAALAVFSRTLDKNQSAQLFKLLNRYKPETRAAKKERLQSEAEARKGGNKAEFIGPKPVVLKYGLNHVTTLVEEGKAKLVAIASDVEPIEMMSFLPVLCRSKNVPYCIVKNKATLGSLVHSKNATCVALTDVSKEDSQDFSTLKNNFTAQFTTDKKLWTRASDPVMGLKNQHMMKKRQQLREIENAKKLNM